MAFSELYRKMNERVSPDPLLKAEVLQAAEGGQQRSGASTRGRKRRRLRPAALAAVALACLITVSAPVCVLAAENPAFNSMLYRFSPELAQFFKPVNLSCEDNGILLEVESAAVEGDSAQVYLTMRDLTGDRIDGTVDLYDSARIRQAYDSVSNCRLVGYDPETKTARFLLSSTTMDGREITGSKITFSVTQFLSHKREYEDVEIPVDWAGLPEEPPTIEAVYAGGGNGDLPEVQAVRESERLRVLKPGAPMEWPVKEIDLTGIGFIDGKLHVQTMVEDNLEKDNHGSLWLEDRAGNRLESAYNAYFRYDEYCDPASRQDYVFDVSREELEGYTLHGSFTVSDLYTEGNWEVTFPVE